MQIYIYILFARFSAKGFSILSNTPFADLTASVMQTFSNPFSIDPHHTKPPSIRGFLPSYSPVFTDSIHNEYGKIILKNIQKLYSTVFCLNTGEYGTKETHIHSGFV